MRFATATLICAAVILFGMMPVAAQETEITPYGFVLFNGGFNDHLATDIPVKVRPEGFGDSVSSLLFTARQTRVGLKIKRVVEEWTTGGTVELDFWGQKGSFNNGGSMQSAPRLRLAFFTIKKKDLQLLFGQDWTCFAPLSPNSLLHVSIPAFSSSGNLWNRMPQVRLDYTSVMSEGNTLLLQLAAVRPLAADATNDSQAELLGAGEYNGMPFGQARVAYSSGKKVTVGASAHAGQADYAKAYPADGYTDDKTSTWGVAGDLKATINQVAFAAEGFAGSNLGMLFSNAGTRKVAVTTMSAEGTIKVEGIDAVGGWAELTFTPKDSKVSFNGGAGLETLDETQVEEMTSEGAVQLFRNMTIFGNVMFEPIAKVAMALEIGYIKSTYKHRNDGALEDKDGTNLNVAGGFRFAF